MLVTVQRIYLLPWNRHYLVLNWSHIAICPSLCAK